MKMRNLSWLVFLALAVMGCAEEESSDAANTGGSQGEPSSPESIEGVDEVVTDFEGALVVNEVVAKTSDDSPDWVELFNGTEETVDVGGYIISDEKDEHVYEIPAGTEIGPGEFWVVEGKGSALDTALDFGLGSEDMVRLFDTDGELVNELRWGDNQAPESYSFGRYPDGGPTTGTLDSPTYGEANSPLLEGVVEPMEEAAGPSTEPYYEIDRVLQVSITIDQGDWGDLLAEGRSLLDLLTAACTPGPIEDVFNWYSATVEVDGEALEEVGIRKKGFFGSLSDLKPALKIRFDKYVEDQLLGDALKRLTLNNAIQDPSKLNTCLTYFLFDKAGIPAPRCNFAKVTVNGDDYGIYVSVDAVKTKFIERNFEDSSGNLYEGTLSDFSEDWIHTMEKKTNEDDDDWSDIQQIIDALNIPGPEGLDALAEIVDLDAFVRFWAMESLVNHWDGYAGNRNNYHMYREPGKPFVFIPWGADATFFNQEDEEEMEWIPGLLSNSLLTQRLYADPEWREQYAEVLLELVDTVWDKTELLDLIDQYSEIIDEYAHPFEVEGAQADRVRVEDFVKLRAPAIKSSFGGDAPEWMSELGPPLPCLEEVGEISLDFETLWGTNGVEDATTVSTVAENTFVIDGEPKVYLSLSATAGYGEKESPEDDDYASLLFWVAMADGSFELMAFNFLLGMVGPDQEHSLDNFFPSGFYIRFAPPFYEPIPLYQLRGGSFYFSEGSIEEGAVISGSFTSRVFTFEE